MSSPEVDPTSAGAANGVASAASGPAAAGDPRARRARTLVVLAVIVLLATAPFFLTPGPLGTLGRILYIGLLAASLDLLLGFTGLPSLGHAAYFGIGAYAAGLLARDVTAFAPALLAVAAAAGLVAALLTGWVVARAHGIYFLMLTLAIGVLVHQYAETADFTGGSNGLFGIPPPDLGSEASAIFDPAPKYWYILAVFALGFLALWLVSRSRFGLALRGIRDNEDRMRALGYWVGGYKFAAYCIAGTVAGLAGSLVAADQSLVTPSDVGFTTSVLAIVAAIIGGAGSLWGPVLGAAVVVFVRDEIGVSLGGHGPLVLGVVFILSVYLLPGGFAGLTGQGRLRGGRGTAA
jgi:branched-chain amino acid transport system permease protein